jgi:ABC-2 type transport system ATP-binding protein
MPNGRATDGRPGSPPSGDVTAPIGVPIESYVTGLYISGYEPPAVANGYYQPPTSTDDTANLPLWSALVQSGVNTVSASVPATKLIVDNAVHQLERYKSPLSPLLTVDAKVPVLQIQGSTDPLFPPIHAQLMWQKVKAFAPDYPIGVVYADVGHSYATNPSDVWAAFNQRGNAFFDHYLRGLGTPPVLDTGAMLTRCRPGSQGDALRTIDGPTLPGLAHDTFKASAATGGQTTNVPLGLEGLATDPIAAGGLPSAVPQPFGKGCRSMSATTDPGVVAWTFPVDRTITVAGQPLVKVTVQTTAPDVELAARLWDVAPDGSQTLISRGVYRLAGTPTAPAGPVAFQLSANAWRVPAGDKLKLEVAGADTPYYQVDAIPSVTNVSGATIEVPVAEGVPSTPAGSASGPSAGAANAAAVPGQLPATGFPETRGAVVGGVLLLGALGLRRIKRRR